jgi:heme-degrading monooxygenase HmoA
VAGTEVLVHLRINDVTVKPARIDELGSVLSNKVLPVVNTQKGFQGLLCTANRTTGNCFIVTFWDSKQSVDASEKAIATTRSETIGAVDAQLNSVVIAEALRNVQVKPSRVGTRTRVVRITAPSGSATKLLDFYEKEAVPRFEAQPGFLNSRLIREVDNDGRFAAVSHWADEGALSASEKLSGSLREQVAKAVTGAAIESVATAEIILIELKA